MVKDIGMKNDDRIQILTESGESWTGTWVQLLMHNPFWLSKLHPTHLGDLEKLLNLGHAYNGGGDGVENGFLCSRKGLKYQRFQASKNIKGNRHG